MNILFSLVAVGVLFFVLPIVAAKLIERWLR